ncbi:MAG: ACP S-malonyltransferase [Rhodospirillaceae bacterium]|nr:ACP S-malonyltransferase [Rhodospirillaceae bacterium]
MSRAIVFPGQGSQAVGMGRDLAEAFPAAREVFQEIDDALEQRLSKLMFDGPESDLTLTENAQPALMAVSLAVLRVIEAEGGKPLRDIASLVAGHSLGEYSALAAAGAFPLADAARLLKTRGRAMQRAVPVGAGAMAAILGLDFDAVRAIAEDAAEGEVCDIANDNGGGQFVVSGDAAAIERAAGLARERGAKRSIMLPVSAPFHCALMAPAADVMAEALGAIEIAEPAVPVVANVTAEAVADPDIIRDLLVRQVTAMVRWRESVGYFASEGVDKIAEFGAGKVLSGLVRRIEPDIAGRSVGGPGDIEEFLKDA